jgi:PAS domain S-box-containing protein
MEDPARFLASVAEQYQNPASSCQDELTLRGGRVFERYSQPQRLGDTIVGRVWSFRDVTEQRRAQTALRESEQRYRQLFEMESDAVILVDCETHRYVDANLSAQRLYGYSREELLQMTPEMLSAEPENTRATIGTGSRFVPLRWHCKKNGERFAVEITTNQFDYQGRRTELATLRDITPRQRVMEMLQETTRQLLEAQSIARLGSYLLDFQSGRWTCSAMLEELFGLEDPEYPKDVAGWLRIVHPEDRAGMEGYLRNEVMANRQPFDRQYRIVRLKDRQERWVHGLGRLIPDEQGGLWQMAGIIQDITERKRVEEANERLVTVVEQAAESIVVTDTNGKMLYVNPAFEKISGYTAAEALGRNPRLLKSGRHDEEFYRQMWTLLAHGEKWSGRMSNRRKDGTVYEEDATIIPVRNAAGRIVNYTAIKRDVTHEVQLEGQLRQSQKMEAVGQLAGGVAHDFNNILVALLMQIELLEMGGGLPAEVGDGLKQIRVLAGRAAELTRQLLLFSRRQVMQPRPLDLNELVANFARLLQRLIREDVRLHLRLHPAPLMIHADAGMLEQVLMNLAVNARDAMSKGGQLVIETVETTVDASVAEINPEAAPGAFVCISVSDTGGGIPPEILPRIFEPFFTTKEVGKGTGLGLATVFGIVKQHHGWIKVDNEPGRGATFRIYLPSAAAPAPAAVLAANRAKPAGGSETILLAEDELVVRKLVSSILERHGYQVLAAANGVEAVKLWREHPGSVALLLTDLVMPGGLSGLELARQLQTEQPRLQVVFISGYSAEIAGRELQLHSGENFVQKPFTTEVLLGTIRRCLDA